MHDFEEQGGIAFFLIFYTHLDRFYYLTFRQLNEFWKRMEAGGRKSFRMDELDETFFFTGHHGILVPYLDALQLDLNLRD